MAKRDETEENSDEVRTLQKRVRELEDEVRARENDLAVFRKQLQSANSTLEGLIAKVADEVKTAALIQKALVPTEFPNIPGFEFSTKFVPSPISGGDYFDIFEHEDRLKFGVVLASSNGYGMSALLLSVLLKMTNQKMTGQHETKNAQSPGEIIRSLAQELEPSLGAGAGSLKPERAHVFYGIVDRRNLSFTYASAGPIWGGVLRAATGKLERLVSDDPPIEKGSHLHLPQLKVLNLEARDRLFLVSGGLLAAKNKAGELFGEDRLIRSVLASPTGGGPSTVHDWRNEILYRVETHASGEDLPHDVTVVVFEVKDRVIRLASRRER